MLVGITGYSMHVLRVLELCHEVRTFCPLATVLAGGTTRPCSLRT